MSQIRKEVIRPMYRTLHLRDYFNDTCENLDYELTALKYENTKKGKQSLVGQIEDGLSLLEKSAKDAIQHTDDQYDIEAYKKAITDEKQQIKKTIREYGPQTNHYKKHPKDNTDYSILFE